MGKDILYSTALNEHSCLVKANAARRDCAYFCLLCHREMILRMGARVRPHFAHKSLSPNCTPETVLHSSFKKLLRERISRSLEAGERIEMQWKCELCGGNHSGNLLKRAKTVVEEYNLGACRPDIALLGRDGNVVAAIEIVVSHYPEDSALAFYKQHAIPLLAFALKSDTELARVEEGVLKPDVTNACLNPKCPSCKEHMSRLRLLIIDGKCWRCNDPMKVAALKGDAGCECGFKADHIILANQNGANLRIRYSKTMRARYAANTCRRCNAFIGEHFLFIDYIAEEGYSRIEHDAGYYCPFCVQRFGT